MDEVLGNLRHRFLQQGDLYRDSAFLDPRRFAKFKTKKSLRMHYQSFATSPAETTTEKLLKTSWLVFFYAFPRLAMTLPDEYKRNALGEYPEDEGASDDENDQDDGNGDASIEPTRSKQDPKKDSNKNSTEERDGRCYRNSCRTCFSCFFKVLYQFGLHSTAYSELYCVNVHLITLAVTQVECETSFFLLKIIKSRLRSMLGHRAARSFHKYRYRY